MLTSQRIAEQRRNAAALAATNAEAERKAAAEREARRLSPEGVLDAVAPLAGVVDIDAQRASLDAARQRLTDLRDAFRRVELALDEDLATDDPDSPRVVRRRARLDSLRADVATAEKAVAEATAALRQAALGQLATLRESGLRAVSAEGLEALVASEAKDALALYRKLAALIERVKEKVLARRVDVDRARLALRALVALGEMPAGHHDEWTLRTLSETDARLALARAFFNGLRAGEERTAYTWLDTSDYGFRDVASQRPLPKRDDAERASTPKWVMGRVL